MQTRHPSSRGEELRPRIRRSDRLGIGVQGLSGLIVERLWHQHLDCDQQVALGAVALANTLTAYPQGAPIGGPRWQPKLDRLASQSRPLDLCPESGLLEGDWRGKGQVVAFTTEDRVRAY